MSMHRGGSYLQVRWAWTNWIEPWLYRRRHGIDYDSKLHRPPTEPDWTLHRGRSNLRSRLKQPFGDTWIPR